MSDVSNRLHRETEAARTLLANLADIIGEDAELAADTVEGETSLNEAINSAVQRLVDDFAAVRGLEAMISDLTRRKDRVENRIDNMRTALAVALEQAGKKKVEHAAVTLSLRNTPASVRVIDEAAIPSTYFKAAEPKLDKRQLLAMLKAGNDIPGAALSNGGQCLAVSWS